MPSTRGWTSQPVWTTPGGSSGALPGNPNNPARPYEPGDKLVPNPTPDNNRDFGPAPGGSSGTNITPPFSPFAGGSGVELQQPIESGPALPSGAAAPSPALASNDPFDASVRSVSNGTTVTARSTGLSTTNQMIINAIFGEVRPTRGTIQINGQPVAIKSPREARRAGIGLVPADRKVQGLVLDLNVRENVTLSNPAFSENVARSNPTSLENVALANRAVPENVALPNPASSENVALPIREPRAD